MPDIDFTAFAAMLEIDAASLFTFFNVIMIDLALAGDNAIIIGMAAAGLPGDLRRKAILVGIVAATVLRVVFALATSWLLALTGLLLAGGLLLLWVCWKMWQELRVPKKQLLEAEEALENIDINQDGTIAGKIGGKTLGQAIVQIIIADVSMSLDNVLAVAGAAQDHTTALVFGLGLSVVLMGVASTFVARLLGRYHWIAWLGLLIILYVAINMIYEGGHEVLAAYAWPLH